MQNLFNLCIFNISNLYPFFLPNDNGYACTCISNFPHVDDGDIIVNVDDEDDAAGVYRIGIIVVVFLIFITVIVVVNVLILMRNHCEV